MEGRFEIKELDSDDLEDDFEMTAKFHTQMLTIQCIRIVEYLVKFKVGIRNIGFDGNENYEVNS